PRFISYIIFFVSSKYTTSYPKSIILFSSLFFLSSFFNFLILFSHSRSFTTLSSFFSAIKSLFLFLYIFLFTFLYSSLKINLTNKYIQTVTIIRNATVIFSLIYPSSIICVLYPDKYNPFSGCIAATILNAPNIITNNVIAKIIIRLILNILYSLFVILVSFIILSTILILYSPFLYSNIISLYNNNPLSNLLNNGLNEPLHLPHLNNYR